MMKRGLSVSLKRVQRLMKLAGLASIIKKQYKPYKQTKELVLQHDNIQLTKNGYKISLIVTFDQKVGAT